MCPSYHDAYKETMLKKYGTNKTNYKKGNFSLVAGISPRQGYIDITHELSELLEKVVVQTATIPKLYINISKESQDVIIDTMHSRNFGRCYSIQIVKDIVKQGIAEIEFLSKMNTYIYFHHPGQWLSSDQKAKLYTTVGHNHFMDMTYSLTENTLRNVKRKNHKK